MASGEGEQKEFKNATPTAANDLRKGGHMIMRDAYPCKIVEISRSKPGKHGSAKLHIFGIDIFTAKKYDEIVPSSHTVWSPIVEKRELPLMYITDDDYLVIQNEDGSTREDIKLPDDDDGKKLKADVEAGKEMLVTVQKALDSEGIAAFREDPKSNKS